MPTKLSHEFVESAYLKANIKLQNLYVSNRVKNDLECIECNFLWKATYNDFQNYNNGCPKCAGTLKLTHEFVESAYLKASIKLLSYYINNRVKNNLECLKMGHKWKAAYSDFKENNNGCPECWRLSIKGKNNSNYNYELTAEDRKNSHNRSHLPENYKWSKAVYERDDYICQSCNVKGNIAHHIDSWKEHKDDRFNIDNGVTLCETCHKAYHHLYKIVNHDSFYCWIIRKSVIKAANWSWFVRYPDSMNERLKYFKR